MLYNKNITALKKRLGRELSYLAGEYKRLAFAGREDICERELLVCDNFYLIESSAKGAVSAFESMKGQKSELCSLYPRIYCHMLEYVKETGEDDVCSASLSRFLNKKQGTDPYSCIELYAADAAFSAAVVSRIYASYKQGKDDDVSRFTRMLFIRRDIDFDEVFLSVSRLEPLLLSDPSGEYPKSDKATKAAYRRAVMRGALSQGCDEISYARRLIEIAKSSSGEAGSLGYYLIKRTPNPAKKLYFPLAAVIFALFSVLYFVIVARLGALSLLAYVFLTLPIFECAKQISTMIVSRFVIPRPLPKLQIDEVGEDMRTLVVITTLLFGEKNDREVFDRLEDFCHLYRGKNVYFGVLGDLHDASEAHLLGDDDIIDYAVRRIESLNAKYGERFVLFVRDRSYSVGEKKYMGWERKRGALIELVRFLRGKDNSISHFCGDEAVMRTVKYVITLDSDTRLSHDTVNKLVGCAAHPQNRPRIEKTPHGAVVTDGYAIFQPRMVSSLESVSRSYFSLMQCGSGGVEFYDSCAFELYQSVFGEGIFCGKGIFDVDAYECVIDGAFPEDSILSHDMLEGTRLRAAYLGDVCMVDSAPASPISYYDRLHRWIRGDIQSLAFCRAPINALSRFKLIDNLLRTLTPIFSLLAVVCAAFLPAHSTVAVLFALAYLLLPAAISLFRPLFSRNVGAYKVITRSYFSYAVGGIVKDLVNSLYSISSLAHLSFLSVDAIMRALWRMKVTRKKMLEWTTAFESDMKKNTLGSYLMRMKLSVIIGLILLVLTDEPITDICALMFISFPFVAYLLSKRIARESASSGEKREKTVEYAKKIWDFFFDFVTEKDNYLPPDNYQILPVERVAHRTSPTNIGMYLCSVLSARDFGFIDTAQLRERLDKTLSTVEKMKKWNGHLYNWYDTRTLELLTPTYVSTVDSGNFFCSLVALREGVLDYVSDDSSLLDIVVRIDALISGVRFSPLYDSARKLFYIGLDPSRDKIDRNYYDLYMSEARCASYFAIARGEIDSEHWSALGRRFIGDGNHIGLASWSGTAFEYFMPALFLPTYPDSLAYEGMLFAFSINKKNAVPTVCDGGRIRHLWGKSESAFYSFDPDMNYRYRAIGERALSLARTPKDEAVFAPYALFLMMRASVRDALAGLSSMRAVGAYGKYGFFESVDLTPSRVGHGRAIVRSYMAHHMGMSLLACANAAFDGVFCKRFMHSPDMRASALLLAEKLPADVIVYNKDVGGIDERAWQMIERMRSRQSERELSRSHAKNDIGACVISDGNMRIAAKKDHSVTVGAGEIEICADSEVSPASFTLGFESGGRLYSVIGESAGEAKIQSCELSYSGGSAVYDICYSGEERVSATAKLTLLPDANSLLIDFSAVGDFHDICPGIVFEPILAKREEYQSHSSFSKLFVEAELDADGRMLLFRKKKRGEDGRALFLAVAFAERGGELEYETKKERVLPELYDSEDMLRVISKKLEGEAEGGFFATVDPICALKRRSVASGKYRCNIIITFGNSRADVISRVESVRDRKKRFAFAAERCSAVMRSQERLVRISDKAGALYNEMLCAIISPKQKKTDGIGRACGIQTLWRYGISGDERIIFVDASKELSNEALRDILASHRLLRMRKMRADLVIAYEGYDDYTNPHREELRLSVIRAGSDELVGKHGGVFLVPRGQLDGAEYEYIRALAATEYENGHFACGRKSAGANMIRRKRKTSPEAIKTDGISVYGGGFDGDGFFVDKYYSHAPWSYVYCNAAFGTLVTQSSLGFTWYKNSREMRITKWDSDTLGYGSSEHIFAEKNGVFYDLVGMSEGVRFTRGYAEYRGELFGTGYRVRVGCDKRLPVKAVSVETSGEMPLRVIYEISFVMGDMKRSSSLIDIVREGDTVRAKDLSRTDGFVAYLYSFGDPEYEIASDSCKAVCSNSKEYFFVLGARPSASELCEKYVREHISSRADIERMFEGYKDRSESLFAPIKSGLKVPEYAMLSEYYLPYQAYYVRMLAKSGFYQSSGAYGFRDQLQDALAALFFDARITKRQIIRCAAHQYKEGDVQHWWHATVCGGRFGIRSRYADDPLWLVYATALYVEQTGDHSILDIDIGYLDSSELSRRENERCEVAGRADIKEALYMHCVRAIERSLVFGEHGLCLFGGGDWNDGMNLVGRAGKGESVWLSWFFVHVLEKMAPICSAISDDERAKKYENIRMRLFENIEKHAWDGAWYLRGFFDDGIMLGASESDECRIDMMSQSFAAFCKGGEGHRERVRTALYSVYDELFDKKNGIVALFAPAFDGSAAEPGYIKSYPAGIRENGGQYTHAAVWYAMALYEAGEKKLSREVMDALNPIIKCSVNERGRRYRNEPYFMSADIYTADGEYGRAGWSGYTGSAAWYLRAIQTCMNEKDKN